MKQTLLVLMTIISFNCYSQIKFEKGYFINNDGERTDCLIKNSDWRNNPMKFQYRLTEDSISKIATIESVKEFGINSFSKYKRFYVKPEITLLLVLVTTIKTNTV